MSFLDDLESSISSDWKSEEKLQKEAQAKAEEPSKVQDQLKPPADENSQTQKESIAVPPRERNLSSEDVTINRKRNIKQVQQEEKDSEISTSIFEPQQTSETKVAPSQPEEEEDSFLLKKKLKVKEDQEGSTNLFSSLDNSFISSDLKSSPPAEIFAPTPSKETKSAESFKFRSETPPSQSNVKTFQVPPSFDREKTWKEEEQLTLEERRKRYHKTPVMYNQLSSWAVASKQLPYKAASSSMFQPNDELNKKVALFHGEIVQLEIDAIVNAANELLIGGGGVDRAIHLAAGGKLAEECASLNGCSVGQAKITRGYDLPAKYVIHAVGPIDENAALLKSSYQSCLEVAVQHKIRSLAFCGISTGVFGYPLEAASKIALATVREWLEMGNKDKVDLIIFCTYLPKEEEVYQNLIWDYFPIQPPQEKAQQTQPETEVKLKPKQAPLKSPPEPAKQEVNVTQAKPQQQEKPEPAKPQPSSQPEIKKAAVPEEPPKKKEETSEEPKRPQFEEPKRSQSKLLKSANPTAFTWLGLGVAVAAVGAAFLIWKFRSR